MSKGLGRGLSSLFAIYDDEPKNEKKIEQTADKLTKTSEKPVENTEKSVENTEKMVQFEQKTFNTKINDDILNNANDLLQKYQKKDTEKSEIKENPIYIEQKNNLEQKLKSAGEQIYSNGVMVRQIPINRIQPNPDQPRKNFNSEALKELAQSIKEHGIIQPIICTVKGENYCIIAGERRYRASKIAGLKTLPVIIKNYNEQQTREVALIENLQREDLNPIETAMAIKQLIDNYGFTQEEIAAKIGKSRPVITNSLRLLNLEPEVLTLVEKGKLQPAIARAIITLPREQQLTLAKKASDDKMTARDVENAVRELTQPESIAIKKSNVLSAEILSLKDEMQQVFGTKVTILGNDKKGRIYLDYYSREDLDRIYNILNKIK